MSYFWSKLCQMKPLLKASLILPTIYEPSWSLLSYLFFVCHRGNSLEFTGGYSAATLHLLDNGDKTVK